MALKKIIAGKNILVNEGNIGQYLFIRVLILFYGPNYSLTDLEQWKGIYCIQVHSYNEIIP
jgi:hypothetical protein